MEVYNRINEIFDYNEDIIEKGEPINRENIIPLLKIEYSEEIIDYNIDIMIERGLFKEFNGELFRIKGRERDNHAIDKW